MKKLLLALMTVLTLDVAYVPTSFAAGGGHSMGCGGCGGGRPAAVGRRCRKGRMAMAGCSSRRCFR